MSMIGMNFPFSFQWRKVLSAAFLLTFYVASICNAQTTYYWQPTTGIAMWNVAANWNTIPAGGGASAVPTALDFVVFNQGNSTCKLPTVFSPTFTTVAGMDISGSFTGSIDLNSSPIGPNTLRVLATGSTSLTGVAGSPASITNSSTAIGNFQITSNFAVGITGISTASKVALSVTINTSGVGISISSPSPSVFNGSVSLSALDNISLNGANFNSTVVITKTGNTNCTIDGGSSNTFTGASTVTIKNNGAGALVYKNDTFNSSLIIQNNGAGSVAVDGITCNLDLTLTQNAGTLNVGFVADCKLAGNLIVNCTTPGFTFGNGLATSGTMEFNGALPQAITIGGGVSSLTFTKISLNKSAVEVVTANTDVQVTNSATMTTGIIAMGSNTITLTDPSIITGYSNASFIDGFVKYSSASGTVTFPTGDAVGKFYRPITVAFSGSEPAANLANISARYFRSAAPLFTSVFTPIANVSRWEYWTVNAAPSLAFNATLPWRNADPGNPNYVTDVNKLRVSSFVAGSWQNQGGPTDGGSAGTSGAYFTPLPNAGIITSKSISTAGANVGNITLGSTDAVANELNVIVSRRRWLGTTSNQWSNALNWSPAAVPTAADVATFDSGSNPCVLPVGGVTVGGLEVTGFTGTINPNGTTLTVNAISAVILSTGSFIGSGTLAITGGANLISISGTTTAATVAVNITGNAIAISSGTLNGSFTASSPNCFTLTGGTFNGATTFTYTGSSVCTASASGNTFASGPTVTIRNTGTGTFNFTNLTANSPVVLDNTNNAGTLYTDLITSTNFTVTGTGTVGIDRPAGSVTVTSTNTGTAWIDRATFASPTLINNSTGILRLDRGTVTGVLNVRQPTPASGQMYLGSAGGTLTLQAGATITATTFTDGRLFLTNFVQTGATAQTLTLANGAASTPVIYLQTGTIFNGNLTLSVPKVLFNGATLNGTNVITQNNTLNTSPYLNDVSVGANVFGGTTTITNSAFGKILLDGNNTFSNLTLTNSSSSAGAAIILGYDASSTGTLADTYNGTVMIQSTGSSPVDIAYNVASQFNNNITTSCTGACTTITFGGSNGTSALAAGKTIVAGGAGFSRGQLTLKGLSTSTAQNITLTGTALLRVSSNSAATPVPSTFNASVNFTSPVFDIGTAVFNGAATMTKTSNTNDSWAGGGTFNANATLINNGTVQMACPSAAPVTFNGNLAVTTQNINATTVCNCKVAGNVTTTDAVSAFYVWLGDVEFIGGALQTVFCTNCPFHKFTTVKMNKTGTQPVKVNTTGGTVSLNAMTFINGIFDVTAIGYLQYMTSTPATGMNNGSYVEGSVLFYGAGNGGPGPGSAPFTFPVGNNGFSRPITISPDASYFLCRYHKASPTLTPVIAPITNASACEYWTVTPGTSPPANNITLSWVSFECTNPSPASNYITSLPDLRVVQYSGGGWKNLGNTATTGTAASGTITSGTAAGNSGTITLGSVIQSLNPLPIELLDFSAMLDQGRIRLSWETATELNNDHFEVERSANGNDFTKIGEVDGHGTTSNEHKYSFLDSDPLVGLSYYRLRQVDFDGESTYSSIVSASNFESDRNVISFFPNPVFDKLYASAKVDVRIVDMLGKEVFAAQHVDEIDLQALNSGVYCVMTPGGEAYRFVKK